MNISVFAAEKIVDERQFGTVTQYCIKWKDFDEGNNTWNQFQTFWTPC